MLNESQKQFLNENRFCIVGYARKDGPPAMSPVYYVMDGDDLLITTQTTKYKGRVFTKERDVSVCVMAENHPSPRYMTIYGKAKTESEGAVDVLMRIVGVFSGNPLPEAARPGMEAKAKTEGRLVLRVKPASAVGQV